MNEMPFCTLFLAPVNRVTAAFNFIDTDKVPGSSAPPTIRFAAGKLLNAHLRAF